MSTKKMQLAVSNSAITLCAADGVKMQLSRAARCFSAYVEAADANDEIKVPCVSSEILRAVITFCELCAVDPMLKIPKVRGSISFLH